MGAPKGLLAAPDGRGPLVTRAAAIFAALGLDTVLVGVRPEYAGIALPALPDAFAGIGPLGGLVSLLRAAAAADRYAIACACDLPFVDEAIVQRLLDAPDALLTAPHAGGVLQPLFARYDARPCLAVAERRAQEAVAGGSAALQGLLRELGATPLLFNDAEASQLRDWDCPADLDVAAHTKP